MGLVAIFVLSKVELDDEPIKSHAALVTASALSGVHSAHRLFWGPISWKHWRPSAHDYLQH